MSVNRWVTLGAALRVGAMAVGLGGAQLPRASAVTTSPATGSSPPSFQYEIREVTAADLPYTYRSGCPVPPAKAADQLSRPVRASNASILRAALR